jgi:ABC-type iron transport system FetAB ATPase subunit
MPDFLVAGPFDARDGEGRVLFEDQGLRLAEGRATVLDGPSGSGKSTLLRLVAALVASGRDVQRRLAGETYEGAHLVTWRSRVTLMAQDAPMIPGSVRDNLELPFRLRCSGRGSLDEKAAVEGLRQVDLGRLPLDRNVDTLSGGERHRLALARGLLWDPPVLLADEPLSGLDADTATSCLELLLAFGRRPGHALLIVLHHRELAARADAVIRLAGETTGIG